MSCGEIPLAHALDAFLSSNIALVTESSTDLSEATTPNLKPPIANFPQADDHSVMGVAPEEKIGDNVNKPADTVSGLSAVDTIPEGSQLADVKSESAASEQNRSPSRPEHQAFDSVIVDVEPISVASKEEHDICDEDEDDEDEEDEDEDNLSDGEDLREDIRTTLSALDFEGTYAASHSFSQAPNPGLVIEGVGVIPFPISPIDADRIIQGSKQAPFGHGIQSVVDASVRHTWEVEAQRVSFYTPAWHTSVNDQVLKFAVKALGVAHPIAALRCELYKLLLYVPGSHFLPHQDFPPESMLHTNVLTWYTDVVHSVTPVQTGYRLALTYNLILTSTNAPKPEVPLTDEAIAKLRRILRKWSTDHYPDDHDLLAYILDYEYSAVDLGNGIKALKGRDAHIVTNLSPVAEEMGCLIFVAKLTYSRIGEASGESDFNMYGRGRHASKRPRWGGYSEDEDEDEADEEDNDGSDCPSLEPGGMEDCKMIISNVVDLEGNLVSRKDIDLEDEQLVPENFFEDADPDRRKYQGYMGNEPGSVEYWYYNSALVLVQYAAAARILGSAYVLGHAISRLKRTDPSKLTVADRDIAEIAVWWIPGGTKKQVRELTEIALAWRDLFMWKRIYAKNCAHPLDGNLYPQALGMFGFEAMFFVLGGVFADKKELSDRVDIIQLVSTHSLLQDGTIPAAVFTWCDAHRQKALETLQHVKIGEVPLIIQLVHLQGVSRAIPSVLSALQQPNTVSDVWIALLKAMHQAQKADDTSTAADWDVFIPQFLGKALDLWISENATCQPPLDSVQSKHGLANTPLQQNALVNPTAELVDLCLTLNQANLCWNFLEAILKIKGDVSQRFKSLYVPLITKLRQILSTHEMHLTAPPFAEFSSGLIGLYLRDILGSRDRPVEAKKIGCGCGDCKALDAYIASQNKVHRFRASKARRSHIENRLTRARDILTFNTVTDRGNPHILLISKKPEALPEFQWSIRQKKGKEFIENFGDMATVSQLMGDRAADVKQALDGVEAFLWVVRPMKPSTPQFSLGHSRSTLMPKGQGTGLSTSFP